MWLKALTDSALRLIITTLAGGIVMLVLWPFALTITWAALLNLVYGLCFNWDKTTKEVESALPQLHGLVDE